MIYGFYGVYGSMVARFARQVLLILSADAEALFRSPDQGKSWSQVTSIPAGVARTIIRHESDSKRVTIPPLQLCTLDLTRLAG